MLQKLATAIPAFILAFGILLISVLRTASVKYEFSDAVSATNETSVLGTRDTEVDYNLAFPGKVLPDNPLWGVKAARDKLWVATTTNPDRKAELFLLFADKRLGASLMFFQEGKAEDGYETLIKAEHYLQRACEQERLNDAAGLNTAEFSRRLAYASLKHRQIIEEEILPIAPDDARPEIIQTLNTAKETYEKATQALNEHGMPAPENPFNRE